MQYIILGLGTTGYSVLKFLQHLKIAEQDILVLDTRATPPFLSNCIQEFKEVKVIHTNFSQYFTQQIIQQIKNHNTTIITSPGVDFSEPIFSLLENTGIKILSDIEIFAKYVQAPVIAITGSNGKSTTTALLGEMARKNKISVAVGGNLGTPVLDFLIDKNHYDLYILELSSFQLQFTYTLATRISCILNIIEDHLDIHGSFAAYCAAKHRIYDNAEVAVFNGLSKLTVPKLIAHKLSFTDDNPLFAIIPQHNLLGAHNRLNIQAALVMGQKLGFSVNAMQEAISTFSPLPHRSAVVARYNNILWVNDSKATNVGATLAALEGLKAEIKGKWIIILGGKDKKSDFKALVRPLQKLCKAAILLGETALQLHATLKSIPCFIVANIAEAVTKANALANSGDGVLLAPACASWDMFDNYQQRGEVFAKCVNDLRCQIDI